VDDLVRVWIDDPNPIFRLGLACCLRESGFVLAGESSGFIPEPDLGRVDVLVFDLGEGNLSRAMRQAQRGPARLLGLVAAGGPVEEVARGLCTVLVRSELTPESFLDCLCSLAGASRSSPLAGRPGGSLFPDRLLRGRNRLRAVARALREGAG
jgi:hypothetical protein